MRRCPPALLAILLFCPLAFAQRFHYGPKIGFTANDTYYSTMDESKPYVFGGFAQMHLWSMLYFDAEGLYRRKGYDTSKAYLPMPAPPTVNLDQFWLSRATVNNWDFPFLLKGYILPGQPRLTPFLEGGYVLRIANEHAEVTNQYATNPTTYTLHSNYTRNGIAAGGGLSIKLTGRFTLEPGYRYTHIYKRSYGSLDSHDIFVGFRF